MEITSRILVVLLLLSRKVNGSKRGFIEPYSMTPEAVPIITAALLECSKKLKKDNREQLENHQQIRRHLLVNIRVNPSFNLENVDQFLILDEIFDSKQRSKAKIMSPYLIEISRGEPVMMYPLEFSESLKLNDSNRTQLVDDTSQNSQNGTSSNQIRKLQKFKSGSISEGEEAHQKKLCSLARVTAENKESCCKPNGVYFTNDFGPSKANGDNIFSSSNVSAENLLAEPLKSSTLEKKKIRENFKTKATSPKALMTVHDNKSDNYTVHKIKDIFQAKRQVDIYKDNSGKFESTDFVLAEPKIKWGGHYDDSDKSKDEIKNVIHNHHSRLKPSASLGSRRGHKKAGKLRFSKHRQRPKFFESGDNNYSISSKELNRYFETRYWPRIYNSLDKITADCALNNRKRTALNDINTKSKYENEPKQIFEGSKILKKNSNETHSFSIIKDKQQNNGNYDELIECRVRKPTKIIRNSNIKPKEDLRVSEMDVSEKKTQNGEGLITSNGFQASGIFLKNMNRGIFQDISRRETNTFDSNRFYEKYLFPQTAKNFPKKFQNRQSPKFLPKRQQFGRNIADHHHKLNAFIESSKQKRSFTNYNDFAERNRLYKNNYDYDFIAYSKYISDSKSRNIDEDEQPCSSCGGKSKKPPTKTVGNIMTRNIKCNCKGYQHECLCSSKKVPRSLYDTWYSVFNMNAPLPFLTTKLRIFHKKKNIWFQTVPSITLSSLSGTFVNTNLSILFSSHVDIIQLEKSLLIQKQRLLIPQDDMNGFQRNVSDKISGNNLDSNQISPENEKLACHPIDGQHLFLQQCPYSADSKERLNRKSLISFVKTIADLGYFPTSVNILDRCLNNSTRLCLNMLSDKVPAYNIKLKMPFQENNVIFQNSFKVKIARIVTDTTTKNILQISVEVISESLVLHIFSISISNCGIPCTAAKSNVMRRLLPFIGDTITFLFPLMQDTYHTRRKFKCDVLVRVGIDTNSTHCVAGNQSKTNSEVLIKKNPTIISSRAIFVEAENRCFCVWHCNCHCITKLETHVNFNICKKMEFKDGQIAGIYPNNDANGYFGQNFSEYETARNQEVLYFLIKNASILLLIMLILGLLKALTGSFFSTSIDRWGFDFVQGGKRYEDSSDCRRFFINVVLFIVFPFSFWWKCFAPTDCDLLAASTEWQCAIYLSRPILSEDKSHSSTKERLNTKKLDKNENILLSQHMDCCSKTMVDSSKCNNILTRLEAGGNLCDTKEHLNNIRSIIFNEFLDINKTDDTAEEHNTKYILKILAESRESLKNLLQSSRINILNFQDETDEKLRQANTFVQTLSDEQIIYRTFDHPIGNVQNIPYGVKYCIQGYFLPSSGTMYEFVSYHPLMQYYGFTLDGTSIEVLRPPVLLHSKEFNRMYQDKLEVLNAKDLHMQPPYCVPCINVSSPDIISRFLFNLSSNK